ncbi:putative membrane protein [Trifolium repens]|nr:putative membrane protein [Trifolium repens]
MGPPEDFWSSLWSLLCFLPYFICLFILGNIKGIIFCPIICLIMTIGNSAIILGLWCIHTIYTYYCVLRCKQLGPLLKLVICTILLPVLLILWPVVGIIGSILGGIFYGFLSPLFATFQAIEEGKKNKILHCFIDGTWSSILKSFDIVKDVRDACFHTYFSVMDDLRQDGPPIGKYYEIRPYYLPGAIVAGILGIIVDVPVISFVAICKVPYMLFKGWNRLFRDLIGREGPFLETICMPFAGLAIVLWPLAVIVAFLASVIASIFLGARAGLVAYQESSFLFGLRYIVATLSLYDEYSNDVLDIPEGSCFPRPKYRRKKIEISQKTSHSNSFSRTKPLTKTISRTISLTNNIAELKPFELLEGLCKECLQVGETLVTQGLITHDDIQEAMFGKESKVISIGLPAYCLLQALLRSIKADSPGILITDDTELTTTNRPKEKFFEWFLNPLLIIKDQIKAENLSVSEEDYLCKLVLFNCDSDRVKNLIFGPPPESDRKLAELDALARRLQGITKFITRFPTYKRRFDVLVNTLSVELADKHGTSTIIRSKSAFPRIFSLKSFKINKSSSSSDEESEHGRDSETSL